VGIPTDLMTHPVAATPALTEVRARLLDRAGKRGIMKLSADNALDLMGRRSGATPSAQKVTRDVQQRFGDADR
jgi:hypothetical protein